jgi:hypothetical protein
MPRRTVKTRLEPDLAVRRREARAAVAVTRGAGAQARPLCGALRQLGLRAQPRRPALGATGRVTRQHLQTRGERL